MYVSFKIPGEDREHQIQNALRVLPYVEYAVCFPPTVAIDGTPTLTGQMNYLGDVVDASLMADYLDLRAREFVITRVSGTFRAPSGATVVETPQYNPPWLAGTTSVETEN